MPNERRAQFGKMSMGGANTSNLGNPSEAPNVPLTNYPQLDPKNNKQLSGKLSEKNVFNAFNMKSNSSASKSVYKASNNGAYATGEKPRLRIKGLTEQQFHAQPGLSKKRQYMTQADFQAIFGSQIAEGQIGADWRTRYTKLFK